MDCSGPESFAFKANDGKADSNIETLSIAISPLTLSDALATNLPWQTCGTKAWEGHRF